MKQYYEMKKKHPDAVLLFRVGDFYETFSDDAITASEILGITLTRRANGSATYVELAGFPHHALDTYLPKLVRAGKRVAICEQLEDPKLTKKLVKRGITELITPGVNMSEGALNNRENNFLAAVHFNKTSVGIAFLDISTGEFVCEQCERTAADKLLTKLQPKELLRMRGTRQEYENSLTYRCSVYELDDWIYTIDAASERLQRHFDTMSLKGFGVDAIPDAVIAAGSILQYLDITGHTNLKHISSLRRIGNDRYMTLDRFTIRNLELVAPLTPEGMSLLDVLDHTVTPMGARLLRNWILFPLIDPVAINRRLDVVDYFFKDVLLRDRSTEILKRVGDLERLVSRLGLRRIGPRDTVTLQAALESVAELRRLMAESDSDILREMAGGMHDVSAATDAIRRTLMPDPPAKVGGAGRIIASGVHPELDEWRDLHDNANLRLEQIRVRETEQTGIPSLKIGFNNVFGYYIEVRNTHKDKVPAEWIRKQTLTAAERYITPELKELEEKIMQARDRIDALEAELFNQLLDGLSRFITDMQTLAHAAERIDTLLALATAAERFKYVRPVVDDSMELSITEGRHPVIERRLPAGEAYISNSVRLDCDKSQIMMITGPNMSGKSALLRQTALITLMAQMGSFVPAQAAHIGFVDKIFTRVGASDNISLGESTFMTEMNEASAILNNMTARSLILFDELGRGTSTYDGISIAWAIVEHIHENGRCRPKTLFATHYHELNEMEGTFQRVVNYNVSVKEIKGRVVFMRKLERGGSEHSFGIHVAKLAGMPPSIVRRAEQVLKQLETKETDAPKANVAQLGTARDGYQLSFFQLDDPLLEQIRDRLLTLQIDNLTPLQALETLHGLQCLLTGKQP